jgi:hypothetical protein
MKASLSLLVSGMMILLVQQGNELFCHGFLSTSRTTIITLPVIATTESPLLQLSSTGSPMRVSTTPSPDEEAVREAYRKWRQKYNKGDFDPVRYPNFKSNFLAVTAKNNMDMSNARQTGSAAPTPIQLNEYGDCSAEEYRAISSRMPPRSSSASSSSSGLRDPNTRVAPTPAQFLQPTNDFNNPKRQQQQQQPQQQVGTTRRQQISQASSNLRAAMDQRTKMESELLQLKQQLEEKQKLLQLAMNEEQYCKNRIALREEQKRILNERLRNGWDDEKGLM